MSAVSSAVHVDDLRVPSGATCTLDGAVVKGNVVQGSAEDQCATFTGDRAQPAPAAAEWPADTVRGASVTR